MYPSVYTLFFTTNSPVEIYIYKFICTFSFRKVSLVYLPPSFFLHYFLSDTMCNGTWYLWWWAFFSWCAFEGRKKASLTKKSECFLSCTSSVFWITDIFSFYHHHHHHLFPFFLTRCSRPKFRLCYFLLLLLLLLSSTPQCPKARAFFVFSFFYVHYFFFVFFNFF